MSKTSKTDLAYMAGIMDGEGSFSISKVTLHSTNGNPYFGYDCKIMVGNTSEVLMKWMVERFGGLYRVSVSHVSKLARAWGQSKIRPCYRWTCEGYGKQEIFILSVLPYLVMKREQAKVALEWVRMVNVKNPSLRLQLHQRMIALNGRFSPTTNMPHVPSACDGVKIESDLHGDMQSAPAVTQVPTGWVKPTFVIQ
jgi:hypothetical protein